jgi:glucose/arabinose dehydrogenase
MTTSSSFFASSLDCVLRRLSLHTYALLLGLRRRRRALPLSGTAAALLMIGLLAASPATAQEEDSIQFTEPGFSMEPVAQLDAQHAVGLAFAPDGRIFVWQRSGAVRIVKNGSLVPGNFIDLSGRINMEGDRGLLGLALDPNFSSNGFVYLFYSSEEDGSSFGNNPKARTARLIRVQADPGNPDVFLPGSEKLILGKCEGPGGGPECIKLEIPTHANDDIRFGDDGKLYVSIGDSADFQFADPLAFNAQSLDSYNGKLLRINPDDGSAPADNPFYDGPNTVKSRIYAYGLRNPFRFTFRPGTVEPYVGDVGWRDWEEVNRVTPGANFGWPCYEGNLKQQEYQNLTVPGGNPCALLSEQSVTAPLYTYHHSIPVAADTGKSVTGGPFYTGTRFPEKFRGNLFIGDFGDKWISRIVVNPDGSFNQSVRFANEAGGVVDIEVGPDGALYYVDFYSGQLRRIVYDQRNPVAKASATPTSGFSPLTVQFSSEGSQDPSGSNLTYHWDFGDGSTSDSPNPSHTYVSATPRAFLAKLTVTNAQNLKSIPAEVTITVGSLAPSARIISPTNGQRVVPGTVVNYSGVGNDPDETITPDKLSWQIVLHHDDHIHPQTNSVGESGSFIVSAHDGGLFFYEIILTVTDSTGLKAVERVFVYYPVALRNGIPQATLGQLYNESVLSSAGAPPFMVNLWSGILPEGLTLASETGQLFGTPVRPGRFYLSLRAADSQGQTDYRRYIFNVCQPNDTPATELAGGELGAEYSGKVSRDSDPPGKFIYSRVEGQLPSGLTLDANTGIISGTPLQTGQFRFRILASTHPPKGRAVGPRPDPPGCDAGTTLTQEFVINVECPVESCPVQVGNFEGYFDGADCDTVWGWAWDQNQPDAPVFVNISADGYGHLGTVRADLFRSDLLAAGKGNGRHAFVFNLPPELRDGRAHNIRVSFAGTSQEINWSPRSVSCTVEPVLAGSHDGNDCGAISGWAMDLTRPNTPIDVKIYDGQQLLTTLSANIGADLVPSAAGRGNGFHGFLYYIPEALRGGSHHIRVVFDSTGEPLDNTGRSLSCPASPVTQPPSFEGFYYHANCGTIGGWAWDSNRPNTPVDVNIYADGALLARLSANLFGEDLRDAGKGDGNHRFAHFIPAYLKDNQFHQLRVQFAGTNTELTNGFPDVNLSIRCAPETETPVPVGGPPTGQPGHNTPTGGGVSAASGSFGGTTPLVRAVFQQVNASGVTTFVPLDAGRVGRLPEGYSYAHAPITPEAFEISTTATFIGPVTLRFHVPAQNDQAEFSRMRILHLENGLWVDRTLLAPDPAAPSFAARTLAARVDSLSPFVIARLIDDETPASSTTTAAALSHPANALGWHNRDVTVTLTASDVGGSPTGVRDITFIAEGANPLPPTTVSGAATQFTITGEGTTIITYFSSDAAGGVEEERSLAIRLDKGQPTISAVATAAGPSYSAGAWTNRSVTVSFVCADAVSGISQSGLPVTLTDEGANQSASGQCVDAAGNSAGTSFAGVNIDKTPPVLSPTRAPSANANGWNNTDVMAGFTAHDALSGLAQGSPPSGAFTFSAEGAGQSHTFNASDAAGNVASVTVGGVNIDKTAPRLTTERLTPANANGWNNTDVMARYSASDELSGLAPGTEVGAFTFTEEGANQSRTFTVTDLAGNVGADTVSGVYIDKTSPTINSARAPEANSHGWNNTDVVASYSASDSLSGLGDASAPTGTFTFTDEGADLSHTFTVTDAAGNSSTASVSQVRIDKTRPTLSAAPDRAPNARGWYNADVQVIPTAADALSGVEATPAVQTLGEGAEQSASFTVQDLAGNSTSTRVSGINIDKTAPTIGATRAPLANSYGWNNTDVTARYTAGDNLSGLADGSPASDAFTFTAEGAGQAHTFTVEDLAGNTAHVTVEAVSIDKTSPAISCGLADGAWHASDVTLPCTSGDGLSALVEAADGSFALHTAVPAGTETADALTDSRTVCDRAGNCATAGPVTGNRVDKKAPDIHLASPTNSNYLLRQAAAANYLCSDGGAGVSGCAGTVANGGLIETATLGQKLFTVKATDQVGNTSRASVNYTVSYGVCPSYDEGKAYRSGSTIPVKLRLCDAGGINLSASAVVVTALGTEKVSDYAEGQLEDAGNANPDDNFRFTELDGAWGYIFNLKTTGFSTGTYVLVFKVTGDPVTHTTRFQIR